ncbi:MAG: hypothetical protein COV55_00460 [Candidatus Komeilibacteria bacterium CG11_big_fil_rev_8_21_14_0_20_36_20]|uniref:Histidine kinase N-terminal 7TM region domain-containing protein n=1 Tax=Candidatus Komeilibacteria bacterium CG11_big_fil_rev_8_21_14_0_20_36_20 TaxID=1974477 RepID=A0A2H0NE78_9BACT|nr:MAG: hypothetical protein COV55_00460 [Candidatus Komeilibacteria bacterium CG11_big_fil_rev_8_21_14_0_20_36_20]PIR81655.1 MAG: hypothetical protein COU21_02315 [Candidatus Komeilibacteria bacterium CG10_big_fil_rev_8_21_14_0_10_36_65]PJC55586.1 MAG: hypothetical protein CO027_01125 [Candidatus Komeilibacteria bacterium CG_4_9_14_0_2_um_filter_36_13]
MIHFMAIQNFILLITGILNFSMSVFIISRGWKNKINLYFSLLTFFTFLWSLTLFISRIIPSDLLAVFFYRSTYMSAVGIAVFLLYFSLYFPYKIKDVSFLIKFSIWLPTIIIVILIYTQWHIIDFNRSIDLLEWNVSYYVPFHIVYGLYFFVAVISAFLHLVYKYRRSENIFKKQIKVFLSMIAISFVCGSYFNLILCYFGSWHYIWLGPLFTLLMNGSVFYLIFLSKDR